MFEVFRVFATLGLDAGEFQNNLSEAEKRLGNAQQTFGNAGRTLTTSVSAPLLAIGAGALAVGANFETSMNQVQALTSATGEEFAALREMAKELGATTQFSASKAADAMGFLAMAGQDTDQILGSMPGTLRLAAAAQMEMSDAADAVTNIMAGFGMEVEDLDGAVDVLVQSFTSANTDLPQLAEAMKYAGPVANQAGVEFEEAAAAVALMGNAGIQGSMAGTSLRGAITRMLNPTSKAADLMREAGISFTDAEGRLRPLDEIVQDLTPHADDAGLFMELFGQRAGPAMAALVGQGSDALTDLTDSLQNSGGRAQEVADVQMEGLAGAMRLLKSAAESVLIAIADSGLLDAATSFLNTIAGWIQNLSEVNPMILRIATVLGGLLAALGPVLWAVGSFAGALGNLMPIIRLVPGAFTAIRIAVTALTGPIGLIITGITLLVTAFATDFLGIRTAVVDAWDAVTDAFRAAWNWIQDFFGNFQRNITQVWDGIKGVFSGAATAVGDTFRRMGDGLRTAWDGIKRTFSGAREHVSNAFTGMQDSGRNMVDAIGRLFRGDFQGAWNAAKDAITGWWDTVNNFLGGIPGKMLSFGRDIVNGLADGIRNAVTNAVEAVTGLGGRLLDNFKGLLGIESPSKVFHGYGLDIGEGLATGIEDSVPRVMGAMETLGHAVALGGAAGLSASGVFSKENVVGGVVGNREGKAAQKAVRERLDVLKDARRKAFATSPIGGRDFVLGTYDTQIKWLEEALKELNTTVKRNTQESKKSTQRQSKATAKFSEAVDKVDEQQTRKQWTFTAGTSSRR